MAKKSAKKVKIVKSRIPNNLGIIFVGDTSDVHPESLATIAKHRILNDYNAAKEAAQILGDQLNKNTKMVTRIPGFRAVFAVATNDSQKEKIHKVILAQGKPLEQ